MVISSLGVTLTVIWVLKGLKTSSHVCCLAINLRLQSFILVDLLKFTEETLTTIENLTALFTIFLLVLLRDWVATFLFINFFLLLLFVDKLIDLSQGRLVKFDVVKLVCMTRLLSSLNLKPTVLRKLLLEPSSPADSVCYLSFWDYFLILGLLLYSQPTLLDFSLDSSVENPHLAFNLENLEAGDS